MICIAMNEFVQLSVDLNDQYNIDAHLLDLVYHPHTDEHKGIKIILIRQRLLSALCQVRLRESA